MKLYEFSKSSASYRVRVCLNLKRLPYESIPKRLRSDEHKLAEYTDLNPQGLVPLLDNQGFLLSQSMAIIEYLDESFPEPYLLPTGIEQRALVRGMSQLIACDIHPLNNLRVLKYIEEEFGCQKKSIDEWYHHWVDEGFSALERFVEKHSTDGHYCFGSNVSMVDICLVPQLYNAERYQCELTKYPKINAVGNHLRDLPAFVDASPDS